MDLDVKPIGLVLWFAKRVCGASRFAGEYDLETEPTYNAPLRNDFYSLTDVKTYLTEYSAQLSEALSVVPRESLEAFTNCLRTAAEQNKKVYVIGNGGSSAIAEHLCCDLTKGTMGRNHPVLRTHSLTSNTPLYSALSNDNGFQNVFAMQVEMFGEPGDVLIAISSSGNSPNIVNAVRTAKRLGLSVVGLSGFSGGRLRETVDISIHINVANYGVVEDAHQVIIHSVAQVLSAERSRPRDE